MTSPLPPKFARWLLSHFGCSPNNDAVIGDLDERYRQGRSQLCYRCQVVKAIIISLAQEVSTHKLIALRAALIGWTLSLAGGFLFRATVINVNSLLRLDSTWISYGFSNAVRHTVAAYPALWLLALILVSAFWWAGIEWILKRLSHPHETTIVLAFVGTVLAVETARKRLLFGREEFDRHGDAII